MAKRNLMSIDVGDLRPAIEEAATAAGVSLSMWLRDAIDARLAATPVVNASEETAVPSANLRQKQPIQSTKMETLKVFVPSDEKQKLVNMAREKNVSLSWLIVRILTSADWIKTGKVEAALVESNVILAGICRNWNQLIRQINTLAKSGKLTTDDIASRLNLAYIDRLVETVEAHMDYQRTTLKL